MKSNIDTKIANAKSLLDVFLIFYDIILNDLHVASLAYVDSFIQKYDSNKGYGILQCKPFPLDEEQQSFTIQAYYFDEIGDSLKNNDIIKIIFTDKNFINNLNRTTKTPYQTTDLQRHIYKFAVVILESKIEYLSDEDKEKLLDI